jgi:quercetin dioxygenase-like cupin family protein
MTDTIHSEGGQTIRFLSETPDALIMEADYRAGTPSPPAHLHPSQDEHFEVLSGGVHAVIKKEARTLRAGDTLDIPAGTVHQLGGLPDTDGTVRWEVRPALRTREFLQASFGLAGSPPDSRALLRAAMVARDYAPEFRLAKPSRPVQAILFAVLGLAAKLRRGP